MGFSGKAKSSNEGWGLGLLFVFFPDDEDDNKYIDKRKKLSYSSSLSSTTGGSGCNSSSFLFSRAQSVLSICLILVFFTLFFFTLSTLERTVPTISPSNTRIELGFPRRWLAEKKHNKEEKIKIKRSSSLSSSSFALQGLGTQFRRGTRAMSDLVVAHIPEETKDHNLRLFLRALHRSGLTSKSDLLFIFPSISPNFTTTIHQENQSFLRLVSNKSSGFDVSPFKKEQKPGGGEPLWGQKLSRSSNNTTELGESTGELSFGSVVGFEAGELDPENSLSGFLDKNDPPMRLRRWACYPMLLGRVRRNFKHLMLVDVKEVVVQGDVLSRVRTRSAESVSLWTVDSSSSSNSKRRKNSEKTRSKSVSADVIAGGTRGVRRLSNALLNEIVRAAGHERKTKAGTVSDSAVLSQLVHNESLMKSVNIGVAMETPLLQDATSSLVSTRNVDVVGIILRHICSSTADSSSVYSDC